jgi:glycosyltransferase involved in cell wall biosynthesis
VPEGVGVDLLFAARPFTGLEEHGLRILRGLRAIGGSVDVWVSESVMKDVAPAAEGHQLVPFRSVPRSLRLGREQWAVPWRFGARPRSYRLVHSVIGVAPLLMDVPLVLTVPDLTFRSAPKDLHPRARLYFGTLVPRSIRRAKWIMVSSEAVRREVIEQYHIAPDRVRRVPLCADAIFHPMPAAEVTAVRKRFGLPERYVLYVGTIEPRKGLPRLRAAYDLLPEDLSDAALVLAGRTAFGAGKLEADLRRPARRGHVILTGYVPREDLPALYSGATAFVYPSHYEGFGLPVLEAMACGAPPIVSSSPALTELVGEAGVVLRTDTIEELTQAMERLLRFEAERESLSRRALDRAAAFTPAQLGRQTAEVYRAALS